MTILELIIGLAEGMGLSFALCSLAWWFVIHPRPYWNEEGEGMTAESPCSSCAYYDDERGLCGFYGRPVLLGEDGACTHYEP